MKCDELKSYTCGGWYCDKEAYPKEDVDAAIAELKAELSDVRDDARSSRNLIDDKNEEINELEDKIQQKDFFWDGCGFSKMGFKNTIDVANYVDSLKAENERLKKKMDEYHLMSDIRRAEIKELKRALWLARAERAVAEQTVDEWSRYKEKHPFGSWRADPFEYWMQAWICVEKICRKKAEEYK